MPLFLLIAGALLALLGLGSIAAGAPDWLLGLSLGATLIQSGMIALVGGLILIGLGLVLHVLLDLLRRFDSLAAGAPVRPAVAQQPEQRPARPASPARAAPQPEPSSRVRERDLTADLADELAKAADEPPVEQPRARRERREPPPQMEDLEYPQREMPLEPERPRRDRPREGRDPREARSEEVARPRRPAAPPPEEPVRPRRPPAAPPFDEDEEDSFLGPAEAPREEPPRQRSGSERQLERIDEPRRREFPPIPPIPQPFGNGEGGRRPPEPGQNAPKFRPAEPPPSSSPGRPGSETVVRSGVIGGMAYTLYVDGSIEAELPIGTVRFNSIAELQEHVMRTGTEADSDFDEQNR